MRDTLKEARLQNPELAKRRVKNLIRRIPSNFGSFKTNF